MKNKEKYIDIIVEEAIKRRTLCLDKNGVLKHCVTVKCSDCQLNESGCTLQGSTYELEKWMEQEYEEPKIDPRLYDAPVDTKILVSNDGEEWAKRYLCNIKKDRVFAFMRGATSYSCKSEHDIMGWDYAKLWEGDND